MRLALNRKYKGQYNNLKTIHELADSVNEMAQAITAMLIQSFKWGISMAGQRSTTIVIPLSLANNSAFASVTPS